MIHSSMDAVFHLSMLTIIHVSVDAFDLTTQSYTFLPVLPRPVSSVAFFPATFCLLILSIENIILYQKL